MVVHFNSSAERLKYLKGQFEEIEPIEAKETVENEHFDAENEKKSQNKASKSKKSTKKSKKEAKNDEIQAE